MDVFIFQMGKVGSSALTSALSARGVNAVQMHWLGKETLVGTLEQSLLNVDIDTESAMRGIEEFNQSILNTRTLYWYKKHKHRDGRKLKILSLTRDPLNWYWGHLAQNFDYYGNEIRTWYAAVTGQDPSSIDPEAATQVFHEVLLTQFGSIRRPIEHPRFDRKADRQRFRGVYHPFLPQQMMKLRLPTAWFDVFFEPETGIDVYAVPFDHDQGVATFENDFAELLLVRYENLEGALDRIGAFVELDDLALERINVTGEKQTGVDLARIRAAIEPHPDTLAKLYGSRYCRHFGYRMPA